MIDAEFDVQMPDSGALELSQAVLVYRGRNDEAFASVHDIHVVDGRPTILAGQPMTVRAALDLSRSLRKSVAVGGYIPDSVLYLEGDRIVWWVPPGRRHIAFQTDDERLGTRGEVTPHPGLVFEAGRRGWHVWACRGSARPTPDTPLYQAPYFNVNSAGLICQGSARTPDGTTAERIDAWNRAFFGSVFTHPNHPRIVRARGGAFAFWSAMLDGNHRSFPYNVLIPLGATLGQIVEGEGGRRG